MKNFRRVKQLLRNLNNPSGIGHLKDSLTNIRYDLILQATRAPRVNILNAVDFFILFIYATEKELQSPNFRLVDYILNRGAHKTILLPSYLVEMDKHIERVGGQIKAFPYRKFERMKNDEVVVRPFIRAWEQLQQGTCQIEKVVQHFRKVNDCYAKEVAYICLIEDFDTYFVNPVETIREFLTESDNVLPLSEIKEKLGVETLGWDEAVSRRALDLLYHERHRWDPDITDAEAFAACAWINSSSGGHFYVRHFTDELVYQHLRSISLEDPAGTKRSICRDVHTLAIETMLHPCSTARSEDVLEQLSVDIAACGKCIECSRAAAGETRERTRHSQQKQALATQQELRTKYYVKLRDAYMPLESAEVMEPVPDERDVDLSDSGDDEDVEFGAPEFAQIDQLRIRIKQTIDFLMGMDSVGVRYRQEEAQERALRWMTVLHDAVAKRFDPRAKLRSDLDKIMSCRSRIGDEFNTEPLPGTSELVDYVKNAMGAGLRVPDLDLGHVARQLKDLRMRSATPKHRVEYATLCRNLKRMAVQIEYYELALTVRNCEREAD